MEVSTRLDAAGLDSVKLSAWIEEQEEFLPCWPNPGLYEYFIDLSDRLTKHYNGTYGPSYFLHMGIPPHKVLEIHDQFWEDFEAISYGIDPIQFLYEVFCPIIQRCQREQEKDTESLSAQPISDLADFEKVDLATAQFSGARPGDIVNLQFTTRGGIQTRDIQFLQDLPVGEEYYYHATSMETAVQILASCPFLPESNRRADFNSAYNLNPDEADTKSWAIWAARRRSESGVGAVLVYKLDQSFWSALKVLDLGHGEDWTAVVKAFRNGCAASLDLPFILSHDVLKGAICMNPRGCRDAHWVPQPLGQQVAIRNQAVATTINDYLVGVFRIDSRGD